MSERNRKNGSPRLVTTSLRGGAGIVTKWGRSVAGTRTNDVSALREAYDIDGDGVAHANLEKLVKRQGFKNSARRIVERNRAIRNGADS